MDFKNWIIASKMKWHQVMVGYYLLLDEGCLDATIKEKLRKKIMYHTDKMRINSNLSAFQGAFYIGFQI